MEKITKVMDKAINDLEKLRINGVSSSSRELILKLLNNHLKYGRKLLVDCDDDDDQGQIDVCREVRDAEQAIKEVENYC